MPETTNDKTTQRAFIALYMGETVGEARILGATSDPYLVRMVARFLKGQLDTRQRKICGLPAWFTGLFRRDA